MSAARQYFGTDGIRGKVGQSPITPDFALRLANAVGRVLKAAQPEAERGNRLTVLIGKDTRISGYLLESAMESGFSAAGVDVVLLGPIPTPAVAHLTRAVRADLGVVISASHNPFDDNGIKFFSAQGAKLADSWELAVESQLAQPLQCVLSAELGKVRRMDDAAGRYVEFCKSTFAQDLNLKGLKIVVDSAHGAAYQTAPKVFHELGAEVINIGNKPDGLNINHEVGATHPEALVRAVLANHADYGIALDGDADRLQVVDGTGRLYNGDELLYAMVAERLARGEAVAGAVGTLMSNMAVEVALKQRGVQFVRAKVGDRYVLEELQKNGWQLGGESSGHLLALDKHSTGDGTIAALQVLQAVRRTGQSLADLLGGVALYPQTMINVRLRPDTPDWKSNTALQAKQAQMSADLGDRGRILIRASGTEPLLRVMVEADDAGLAARYAQELADVVLVA